MAFIEWKDDFCVGNPVIDQQHQNLVAMINKLHDAMKIGKAASEAKTIINEMVDYSVMHFTTEEKIMQEIKFPDLQSHIKEHRAFVQKAQEFQTQIDNGSLSIGIHIASFLKDWLSNHILINDKAYSKYLPKS